MTSSINLRTHFRACNLCEAICGLEITVNDQNEILTIKGDEKDPFSRGHICPKAVGMKDIYLDKNRLKQPVRRTAAGWETISWEEAFTEVTAKFKSIQAQYGKDAVGVYQGNPSVHNSGTLLSAPGFLRALGTRNRFSATSADQLPHHFAAWQMFGHPLLLPIPDIDHTDFMLIIGANPLASNGSLMTVPDVANRLKAIQKRGGKFIVIDPRRTETAKIADQHLFIKPATDVFLLLSLVHEITQKIELTDDIQRLKDLTQFYTPETVFKITGIEVEQIKNQKPKTKDQIIVALDVSTADEAREIIADLREYVGAFKIGLQLFSAVGASFVKEVVADGVKLFLDVKFHDIPNTVAKASVEVARLGVWMFNIHALGGGEMMRKTVEEVREVCDKENLTQPKIIGVTVLTSSNQATLHEVGITAIIETQVLNLAKLSAKCGLDGVVASPHEVETIRQNIENKDFLIVTPGIRSRESREASRESFENPIFNNQFATNDDQRRVMTPAEAIKCGADYLVIGRPILQADDKILATKKILEEIEPKRIHY